MPTPVVPTFSLVLPSYNPGPEILRTWNQVTEFLARQTQPWEVLFVCDGSRDGSDAQLKEWAAGSPYNIRVLRSPRNRGKGHAVRRGLLRARGQHRIFTDVDLAYPLEMVEAVADQLAHGQQAVIGSRAHRESEVLHHAGLERYLRRRKVKSFLFSSVAHTLLGIRQKDPQAGLKGFSAELVRQILPYVKCQGFGFDCELLVACRHFGVHVREMPVRVRYDSDVSTTHLTNVPAMLNELLDIRRRWRLMARKGPHALLEITARHMREARRYRDRRHQLAQRLTRAAGPA